MQNTKDTFAVYRIWHFNMDHQHQFLNVKCHGLFIGPTTLKNMGVVCPEMHPDVNFCVFAVHFLIELCDSNIYSSVLGCDFHPHLKFHLLYMVLKNIFRAVTALRDACRRRITSLNRTTTPIGRNLAKCFYRHLVGFHTQQVQPRCPLVRNICSSLQKVYFLDWNGVISDIIHVQGEPRHSHVLIRTPLSTLIALSG